MAARNHSYHQLKLSPVLVISISEKKKNIAFKIDGVKAITLKDNRWSRPDIKTTQLLPNILAKSHANSMGAYEAIYIDIEGFVTEGSSSNIWILNNNNELITRNLDGKVLSGITRNAIIKHALNNGISFLERKFSKEELYNAKEIFLTSASSFVTPIIQIDYFKINNGLVGDLANQLRKLYLMSHVDL